MQFASPRSSLAWALALVACAGGVAACGGSSKPTPRVQLQINSPSDGALVRSGWVAVSGSVSPSNTSVLVLGKSVPVASGAFSAQVPLRPGTNIIDVLAGAPHAQAAMHVFRIVRQIVVPVPELAGDSSSGAVERLKAVGLVARIRNSSGPFDFLIPISPQVCGTDPGAGQTIPPGSAVDLNVSKTC
jgi:Glucodextranase, domain B/PASTA domain